MPDWRSGSWKARPRPLVSTEPCRAAAAVVTEMRANTGSAAPPRRTLLRLATQWLMDQALAETSLKDVVNGLCERLAAAGLPIKRVHLSFSMLHPLYDALGFTWERGGGMSVERFRTKPGDRPDRFLKSPYYHLISNNLGHSAAAIDIRRRGGISYFRRSQELGDDRLHRLCPAASIPSACAAWSAPGRPTSRAVLPNRINALIEIQTHLAVAGQIGAARPTSPRTCCRPMSARHAGSRVLLGQVKRGDGETIRGRAGVRGSPRVRPGSPRSSGGRSTFRRSTTISTRWRGPSPMPAAKF